MAHATGITRHHVGGSGTKRHFGAIGAETVATGLRSIIRQRIDQAVADAHGGGWSGWAQRLWCFHHKLASSALWARLSVASEKKSRLGTMSRRHEVLLYSYKTDMKGLTNSSASRVADSNNQLRLI